MGWPAWNHPHAVASRRPNPSHPPDQAARADAAGQGKSSSDTAWSPAAAPTSQPSQGPGQGQGQGQGQAEGQVQGSATAIAPSTMLYWSPSATAAAKHTAAALRQRATPTHAHYNAHAYAHAPAPGPPAAVPVVPWSWFPHTGAGADLQPFVYLSRRRPLPPDAPSVSPPPGGAAGYWGGGGECLALNEHGVAVYVGYVLQVRTVGRLPAWKCVVRVEGPSHPGTPTPLQRRRPSGALTGPPGTTHANELPGASIPLSLAIYPLSNPYLSPI